MVKTMVLRENRAVEAVLDFIPTELAPRRDGAVAVIRLGRRSIRLRPVWVGHGYPGDLRRAMGSGKRSGASEAVVYVAVEFSTGARLLLEQQALSWIDETGSGTLRVPPGVFISRGPVSELKGSKQRGGRVRWNATAALVAEVLLSRVVHEQGTRDNNLAVPQGRELARMVGVSDATIGRVLTQFESAGYAEKRGASRGPTAARALVRPGELLSAWAAHYSSEMVQQERLFHVPWRDPVESERLLQRETRELRDALVRFSGQYAAEALAPFLTRVDTLLAYVDADHYRAVCGRLVEHAEVTEVGEGERIRVRAFPEALVRFGLANRFISPVRIYADLVREGGRSAEAAEVLRADLIGW